MFFTSFYTKEKQGKTISATDEEFFLDGGASLTSSFELIIAYFSAIILVSRWISLSFWVLLSSKALILIVS